MELPRIGNAVASNNTLDESMQFNSNYSVIARDEQSFMRKGNIQTTQSTLVGIEKSDISWMMPDEISLFQSEIMNPTTSRLPPEGAERKTRLGAESLDVTNMSDCSQYKELLQLVNKYDLEDVSVSDVPDKILPLAGGPSYRDRIDKQRAEGTDISVPSTEQLLVLLKESEGMTPTKIYDRIMESSYPKKSNSKISESDMDITSCGRAQPERSSARQTIDQTFNVTGGLSRIIEDSNKTNRTIVDSFVAMSNSIIDKDEKSFMEKYAGLPKQVDITCPADQPTLPWNVSNVTIFDLDATGSLPPRRIENSMQKLVDGSRLKSVQNEASRLDDLAERIYNLSPSTSFSSISKMILDSTREPGDISSSFDWQSLEKITK